MDASDLRAEWANTPSCAKYTYFQNVDKFKGAHAHTPVARTCLVPISCYDVMKDTYMYMYINIQCT